MYYLYLLRNGQSSDNSIVRKNEQPQLPTQNKLPPCSGHSSDLKISLESGHSSDLKISLQGFHCFKQISTTARLPQRTSLLAMEISRMPLPHFEKKNESLTSPSHNCSLWSASISFSLYVRIQAHVLLVPVAKRTLIRQFNRSENVHLQYFIAYWDLIRRTSLFPLFSYS